MKVLGIETSCDETAVAVVEDGRHILSNVVASQVELHARFGGIVPEVASRQHLLAIIPTLEQALAEAAVGWADLEAIAVTVGPGLPGSLLVGVNVAKALAWAHHLTLLGVNHLEGHIYAPWLEGKEPRSFPCLCLIVSGGHTEMALMQGHGSYLRLGRTRDDAAGEAFDKASRLLNLGYPGGPALERAAGQGQAVSPLPRAWLKGSHDFSFSGLKTALGRRVGQEAATDLAASFQEAVVEVLVVKAVEAARRYGARHILLAGGVAANRHLRQTLVQRSPLPVLASSPPLCTDNGAMIASCGYFRLQAGQRDGWDLDAVPGMTLGQPTAQ